MSDRRLSPADACWLYSDFEGNHQTVSALLWLDREIDPDEFRSIVQERLVNQYPVFSQRIRPSRNPLFMPHWEDDPEFDVDYHVDVIQLPEPGDRAALEALVSEQRSEMLDRSRPLWRFHLIQGYEGRSAIHTRIQHAIADGWALVRLVMSLADETSEKPAVEVVDREPKVRRRETAKQQSKDAAGLVVDAGKRVLDSVADTAASAAEAVMSTIRNPSSIPAQLASGADALNESLSVVPDPKRFLEFGAAAPGMVAEQASGVAGQASSVPGKIGEQMKPVTDAVGVVTGGAESAVDYLNSPKPGKTILHGTVSGKKKVSWLDPIPLAPIKDAGKCLRGDHQRRAAGRHHHHVAPVPAGEGRADRRRTCSSRCPISLRRPDRSAAPRPGEPVRPGQRAAAGRHRRRRRARCARSRREIDEIKASQLPIVSFGLVSVAAVTTPEVERLIHKITQEQSTGVVTNVPGPAQSADPGRCQCRGCLGHGRGRRQHEPLRGDLQPQRRGQLRGQQRRRHHPRPGADHRAVQDGRRRADREHPAGQRELIRSSGPTVPRGPNPPAR